jgi:hypothetical protein
MGASVASGLVAVPIPILCAVTPALSPPTRAGMAAAAGALQRELSKEEALGAWSLAARLQPLFARARVTG